MSNRPFVLVTGASGAIGSAAAEKLAGEGYSLFLHCHKAPESRMNQLAGKCREHGAQAYILRADLSKENGAELLLKQVHSPVSGLVYAAGASLYGLLQDAQPEEIMSQFHAHLIQAVFMCQKLLPPMIQEKQGKIVFISSIWATSGTAMETVYSAAKGGMEAFIRSLAKEAAPSGINVNAVAPGVIDTPMNHIFSAEERAQLMEQIPAGRMGRPEEIAEAVAFLFSTRSAYMNGHILQIDGGFS
ncbi:elongation factor P 5-aminopentanone reductase [Sinobaca sp. H24]|uniref:elongation factor P 5-aminopentanone reductase n=1 Tax=Sinobaca sp. H24 TaxID=2923376 RepID=UPI002079FE9C|nr:SDR family oxidoreductase [Sinobaca sp. H24]